MHQVLLRGDPLPCQPEVLWDGSREAWHRGYLGADDCMFPVREATDEEPDRVRHPAQERHKFALPQKHERWSVRMHAEGRCRTCGADDLGGYAQCKPCRVKSAARTLASWRKKKAERECSQVHEAVADA
jgi:hypothetical protein